MNKQKPITVEVLVKAPIEKVWKYWNEPEHIVQWAFASADWEAPAAENDVRVGGKFKTVMAARDKSASFDFAGEYTEVKKNELIEYDFGDRHAKVEFSETSDGVKIVQTFDPENENPIEMQRSGWQAILANFKKHVEAN